MTSSARRSTDSGSSSANWTPVLAIDQTDGFAWTLHGPAPIDVVSLYTAGGRRLLTTALEVLRRMDDPT